MPAESSPAATAAPRLRRPIALLSAAAFASAATMRVADPLVPQVAQMAPEARGLAVGSFASCFFLGRAAGAWLIGRLGDRLGFVPLFAAAGLLLLALALAFARALGRPG